MFSMRLWPWVCKDFGATERFTSRYDFLRQRTLKQAKPAGRTDNLVLKNVMLIVEPINTFTYCNIALEKDQLMVLKRYIKCLYLSTE